MFSVRFVSGRRVVWRGVWVCAHTCACGDQPRLVYPSSLTCLCACWPLLHQAERSMYGHTRLVQGSEDPNPSIHASWQFTEVFFSPVLPQRGTRRGMNWLALWDSLCLASVGWSLQPACHSLPTAGSQVCVTVLWPSPCSSDTLDFDGACFQVKQVHFSGSVSCLCLLHWPEDLCGTFLSVLSEILSLGELVEFVASSLSQWRPSLLPPSYMKFCYWRLGVFSGCVYYKIF